MYKVCSVTSHASYVYSWNKTNIALQIKLNNDWNEKSMINKLCIKNEYEVKTCQ